MSAREPRDSDAAIAEIARQLDPSGWIIGVTGLLTGGWAMRFQRPTPSNEVLCRVIFAHVRIATEQEYRSLRRTAEVIESCATPGRIVIAYFAQTVEPIGLRFVGCETWAAGEFAPLALPEDEPCPVTVRIVGQGGEA